MVEYKDLYEDVKKLLSEKRFKHCEGVVKRAIEYAEIYNVDTEVTKLVAIAHDIAKELSEEETNRYLEQYNIELDDIERCNKNLLHAKIGAYICKDKYGFTEDMVNAVRFHTTGRPNMTMFEKIVFIADKIDETRQYEGIEELRNLAFKNIDKAIIKNIDSTTILNLQKGRPILEESIKTRNYLLINKNK